MARQTITGIWASAAAGDKITAPTTDKLNNGWVAEKPSFRIFNWFWQKITNMIQNAEKYGIMEWSSETNYPQYGLTLAPATGIVYKSKQANNLNHAVTDPDWWEVAIVSKAYVDSANRFFFTLPAQNLANVGATWTTLISSGAQTFVNKLTFIEFKASFSGAYTKTISFQLLVDGFVVDTDYWQSAYGDGATYSYSPHMFYGSTLTAGTHTITVQFKGNGLSAQGPIHLATY